MGKKKAKKKSKPKKAIAKKCTEPKVIPTGIPGFDQMVNGGFKPRSVNIIVGGAGSGKTIFAAMFLLNGLIKYGEAGVYITFEEKKEKFYKEMACFGYDLEKLEKTGKFVFLGNCHFVNLFLVFSSVQLLDDANRRIALTNNTAVTGGP